MDLRQLKSIIKEFEDSTVHKLEITEKDFTVKLEKKGNEVPSLASIQNIPTDTINQKQPEEQNTYVLIKAPLVGTFYDSPSPESDPYVILNQKVNKGDILFIVEAMKVMNEITAPVSGVVKRIHAKSTTMVEYGQVIMEIEE
jgi:acetyl-CoA carboxylase biotin carboxyl carrier protein